MLVVYNMLGQEVAKLVDDFVRPGRCTLRFDATRLSRGMYFYALRAGNFEEAKRMTLVTWLNQHDVHTNQSDRTAA